MALAKAAETREGLKTWNEMDKPPKEEAKVGVQRALREIGQRRANEGRDPPPPRTLRSLRRKNDPPPPDRGRDRGPPSGGGGGWNPNPL